MRCFKKNRFCCSAVSQNSIVAVGEVKRDWRLVLAKSCARFDAPTLLKAEKYSDMHLKKYSCRPADLKGAASRSRC